MSKHDKKRFFWGILIVLTAFICGLLDYTTSTAASFGRSGLIKERISQTTTADDLKAIQKHLKEQGVTMEIKSVKYNDKKQVSSISVAVDDNSGHTVSYETTNMSKTDHFSIVVNFDQHSLSIGAEGTEKQIYR